MMLPWILDFANTAADVVVVVAAALWIDPRIEISARWIRHDLIVGS